MQFEIFKEKFPIYTKSIPKTKTMDELIEYFQAKIEAHPVAVYITLFDHYAHTSAKEEAQIAEDIVDVKNIVFCFGKEIPNPKVPAVRPRSIAITETKENFVIAFMEAPNEKLSQTMVEWVEAL
jgi:hypothetical protein